MIRFENVTKLYPRQDKAALDGVNLEIAKGEFVFLVGLSGSGKSTFLRLVLREERPTSGVIHVAGKDLNTLANHKVPELRRQVGTVFQDFRLLPNKTVSENVAFTLHVLGYSNKQISRDVPEVLELVGLEEKGDRKPSELSGGEQQRIALARALAPQPPVVLLDEPYGALDEVLREELGWEVKEILSRRHTAAILVTHDRHEAITLGDRVAVMDSGQILQCDAPRTVYDKPATRFVADFLAVSSYLSTSLGAETLVRPHQLHVSAGGPHIVLRVEFLGATSRYTIRTASGAVVVADVDPNTALNVDDSCDVHIRERHDE